MFITAKELAKQSLKCVKEITIEQWHSNHKNILLIDVREKEEADQGMIAHATHISKGLLECQIFDHPKLKTLTDEEKENTCIALYCRSGMRSAIAGGMLVNMGFKNVNSIQGGYLAWLNTERLA